MKITYVGPDVNGVTLAPSEGCTHCPKYVPVNVPKALAVRLLQQDTFTTAQRTRNDDGNST